MPSGMAIAAAIRMAKMVRSSVRRKSKPSRLRSSSWRGIRAGRADPIALAASAYEYALKLLTARPYTARSLHRKLGQKGFPSDDAAAAMRVCRA